MRSFKKKISSNRWSGRNTFPLVLFSALAIGIGIVFFTSHKIPIKQVAGTMITPTGSLLSIVITFPRTDTIVPTNAYFQMHAVVAGPLPVKKVIFRRRGIKICADTTAPYSCRVFTAKNSGVNITYAAQVFWKNGQTVTARTTIPTR